MGTKAASEMDNARRTKTGGDLRLRGRLGAIASIAVRKKKADTIAADLAPYIQWLQAEGVVRHKDITAKLNENGARTSRGGCWTLSSVRLLLMRIKGAS